VSQPGSRHDAADQSPGFLLWRATLSWQRQIRAALSPHALTHVQFVLLASLWWLHDHGSGPPSQQELAAHAGTDPMMTSQVLRKLDARNLVDRHADPDDSRAMQVTLTDAGRTLLRAALADVEAADEAYFGALGNQRDAFTRALSRLSAPGS
jgi:DNA-binding MarR family transcriptional regulator